MTPSRSSQITRALLIVWLAVALLFATFPGIDLAAARLVYDPVTGTFPAEQSQSLQALRSIVWKFLNFSTLGLLGLTIYGLFTRHTLRIPPRFWGWCVSLVLLGPGILVNLILKSHWGRARPAQIEQFGGQARFTPPFQITDQCQHNCSFVSGEASLVTAGGLIIGAILWHVVPPQRRRWLVATLAVLVLALASMRFFKGRHFLSDVIWAMIFTSTLAWTLARLFRLERIHARVTASALAADARTMLGDLLALGRRLRTRAFGLAPAAASGLQRMRQIFARNR
ncbi:phosphatase PAP2 family protein [Pseudodonghicola xiamenensis]|nr:phosphatase PAP2 family protein [Pseudodonghicola xiamenensis]